MLLPESHLLHGIRYDKLVKEFIYPEYDLNFFNFLDEYTSDQNNHQERRFSPSFMGKKDRKEMNNAKGATG